MKCLSLLGCLALFACAKSPSKAFNAFAAN
jgi:hypothetical protein